MLTLYLAGPDVFRTDAAAYGRQLQALCTRYGFIGLYPLDNALPAGLTGHEAARWIYDANIALIHRADAVMANLDDFRGLGEADSGTAFEVGFAAAHGKPVWGYTGDAGTLLDRVKAGVNVAGEAVDANGFLVEDFGHGKNLMLACSARIVEGGPEACLQAMAAEATTG